jgi:exportin-2 (importin alpha re-exporter)
VRNLTCTTADEELFQDNPTDYIRKDMEGSDQHTRRRSAMELVRALLKQFAPQVSALCEAHMGSLLEQYAAGGGRNWRLKDAALHLLLASAARNATCTELNPLVHVQSAFTAHVLPEVQMTNGDVSVRPVLKADALKLLCLFRTHLPGPFLVSLLPAVMAHLRSRSVVVQTYAALTLERWLSIKDASPSGVQVPRVPAEHLHAHLDTLFTTLFAVLENVELPENDHVMKVRAFTNNVRYVVAYLIRLISNLSATFVVFLLRRPSCGS